MATAPSASPPNGEAKHKAKWPYHFVCAMLCVNGAIFAFGRLDIPFGICQFALGIASAAAYPRQGQGGWAVRGSLTAILAAAAIAETVGGHAARGIAILLLALSAAWRGPGSPKWPGSR